MIKKTLGGDRLGSGNRMKVELKNYERSTQNLSYLWRTTMSPGTLVPFLSKIGLPGDTWDIYLNMNAMTHPTIGPLFGSFKWQLDVFMAPIRLYNSLLHNNALNIGLDMSQVKLPQLEVSVTPFSTDPVDIDNSQIHPSCILSYLGLRGFGYNGTATAQTRRFNILNLLMYWEIYKNYYANKQEEIGAVIHTPNETIIEIDSAKRLHEGTETLITQGPGTGFYLFQMGDVIRLYYTGATEPIPSQIMFLTDEHGLLSANDLSTGVWLNSGTGYIYAPFRWSLYGDTMFRNWDYRNSDDINTGKPAIATFPLSNIDDMRHEILTFHSKIAPFIVNDESLSPYGYLTEVTGGVAKNCLSNQEGLGLKTYQSDLFNNWIQTDWIDGAAGINTITAIDTTGGSFTLDTLNISYKVYQMLNRIAVSGGTYNDWLEVTYMNGRLPLLESPMYMGGLMKEMIFQEVISNAQSESQPLGTLAGRGVMSNKHEGGKIVVKCDEPCYIMGIISATPRIDYSQGNSWDMHLQTLDDLHKPQLDEIGFQELITEQMAWWDTHYNDSTDTWEQQSAGKQPAWINYMTSVNEIRGNFAIQSNEMFMTLNRRYEPDDTFRIKDLTTYIDPSKYNFIFAETSLDAQNFWTQIAIDITCRRKMSAKVIPNL